ncbi:transglutaminase [Catellatospora sp. TT07R-123]|uniref:transglutaminase TgpA family protein n=1 Tax=Catellatospora sp. TT07R-123 TaxID=2733863 RepID=UPI001B2F55A5|nr:DUF3488 and transglutaminase-like domain-containing protein [Catellatospora sp. TT07R-123]GHJ44970.1 transglutaminase [Catellatospora sp. TT07R-123]
MNSRRHLGLVAAGTTLLASAPISLIFDGYTWLFHALLMVALVAGAALAARSLRGRTWAQLIAMIAALLLGLTWLFGDGTAALGLIPTPGTFRHFGELLALSGEEIRSSYVPVPDLRGLLFISAMGIGAVAILVDLCAVSIRRPALAGLPMLAIYSVPVAVYVDSVSPVPFAIGAVGFLWLLVSDNVDRVRRFGRRFTGEGRGVDVWEPSPLSSTGRRLATVGVIAAVLLPLAVPAMGVGFFSQFGTGEGLGQAGKGGRGATRVDLFAELSGRLRSSAVQDMVKVSTTDTRPFYLRFGVADEIGDKGFSSRQPAGQPVNDNMPTPVGLDTSNVVTLRNTARVEVTQQFAMPLVPVFGAPVSVRKLGSAWSYDPNMQIVYSQRENSAGRSYEFDYLRPEFTPDQLRTAQPLAASDPVQRQFSRVPQVQFVADLVERLTKDKTTPYDKVRGLYDYFSSKNEFRYDQLAPSGTSGDAIVDFLEAKQGFCEQYAAALAWMARTAGMPARVAFGFALGNNFREGVYTLTNKNLHAWTEVYFAGFGWVPFDATPAAFVMGSVNPAWAPNVDAPDLTPGNRPSIAPGGSGGPNASGGPTRRPLDPGEDLGSGPITPTSIPAWVWWSLGGGLVLLLVLAAPALRRTMLRRRRGLRTPAGRTAPLPEGATDAAPPELTVSGDLDAARRRAHLAWDELIDTMIDFRVTVDPAETPRATVDRLIRTRLTGAAEHARLLGVAEERARYAPVPLSADRLGGAVRAVRAALAADADRGVRLAAVLMPPSVLLRWRNAVYNATAAMSARSSALGERLVRLTRPLRIRRPKLLR